ncbi:MAG TPA: class I SAM-dependent methyltransferase [Clostridia bacterium]
MNFNIEAANWDSEKRIERAKIIADEIIKSVPIEGHLRALEFGCGTGLVSFNLADKFNHITLIDTSEGMIDKLNQKIQDSNTKNMNAFCMDINGGSKLNDKYDVIYTSMALHHTQDINLTLERLYELLNAKDTCVLLN